MEPAKHDPIFEEPAFIEKLIDIQRDDLKREDSERTHLRGLVQVGYGIAIAIGAGCFSLTGVTLGSFAATAPSYLVLCVGIITFVFLFLAVYWFKEAFHWETYQTLPLPGRLIEAARADQRSTASFSGVSLEGGVPFAPTDQEKVDLAIYVRLMKMYLVEVTEAVAFNREANERRHAKVNRGLAMTFGAAYTLTAQATIAGICWLLLRFTK